MPQESDYLTRAIEGYQRALTLYTQASSLPTAPMNIRATQRALDQAQRRLDEITPVATEPASRAPEPVTPLPEPAIKRGAKSGELRSVAVTYVSASDRDALAHCPDRASTGRATCAAGSDLHRRCARDRVVATVVASPQMTNAHSSQQAKSAHQPERAGGFGGARPTARPVIANASERRVAATRLYQFVTSRA